MVIIMSNKGPRIGNGSMLQIWTFLCCPATGGAVVEHSTRISEDAEHNVIYIVIM